MSHPHSKRGRISLALCAAGLAWLAGGTQAGTVVIIEGTDATRNATIRDIADRAQANYSAQGYTISRLSNQNGALTRAQVLTAINANGVNAVFFMGHGAAMANGTFTPGIVLNSATGEAFRPQDLTQATAGIRHVEFQACGQNLQGWRDAFPNANLDAWTRSVTTDQIVNDVRFGSRARIPQKNPPNPPPPPPPPPPERTGMDQRFENAVRLTASYLASTNTHDAYFNNWPELSFTLSPSTLAQFGPSPRTFNIQTTDGTDTLVLRSLTIVGGHVVADEPGGGVGTPDFSVTFQTDAFEAAMENTDLVGSMFGISSFITGNLTSVSDQVCYDAAAAVYFGYGAVPAPGTLAGVLGVGVMALRRRR